MSAPLTHAGLFEGYGGTTMAASAVLGPLDTLWTSEIKPAAVALLAHRYPDVPNVGDIMAAFPAVGPLPEFAAVLPRVDVATFSWPCQPFALAGLRRGELDPRALWPNVARFVAEKRPRVLLGENVARIATNGELARVARDLDELGYAVGFSCLPASRVGAPHRRERCFVVGLDRCDTEVLELPVDLSALERWPLFDPDERIRRFPTPEEKLARSGADYTRAVRPLSGGDDLTTAMARLTMFPELWDTYAKAIKRWEDVLDRPAPEPTALGVRAPHRPQLSARFVEWLMGLPAGWVTDVPGLSARRGGHRSACLSLLGDGVVPRQGAYAFASCLSELITREDA